MMKYQLTPIQKQIYDLIVLKATKTRDIAKIINRSQHTVERNIEIILEYFGVDSQKELIVKHYHELMRRHQILDEGLFYGTTT